MSASKSLREMGLSTIVLEANGHAGGRCVTDVSQFSVPFDRGGSWLHSAEINPLAQIAVDTGSKIHKEPWNWTWVHSLGHDLGPQEVAEYRDYQQALWAIVDDAGGGDIDCTPLSAMPDGAWTRTIRHSIAQMLAGDGDVTSATDSRNYIKAPGDWLVEGGLGNFIHG